MSATKDYFVIRGLESRRLAHQIIESLKDGSRFWWKGPRRTPNQSDLMWSILSDLSFMVRLHNQKMSPEDWKIVLLKAWRGETIQTKTLPDLWTGLPFPVWSTRELAKEEMQDFLEFIISEAAARNVPIILDRGREAHEADQAQQQLEG